METSLRESLKETAAASSLNDDSPSEPVVSSRAWKSKGHLFRFNPHLDDDAQTTIDPVERASTHWIHAVGWTTSRYSVLMANGIVIAQIYSLESSSYHEVECKIVGFP